MLKSKRLHIVKGCKKRDETPADNMHVFGDGYVVEKFGSPSYQALILKCPFCGMEMATTRVHKIRFNRGVTISKMIQCPYTPSTHVFKIKNNRFVIMKSLTKNKPHSDGTKNKSEGIDKRSHVQNHAESVRDQNIAD